ncbi:hypothetical protein THOG05_400023 [Vibrio rotiferianus]|nr:hypothetical protein THOG05_400023 [Vibrio rotiferianus]CAH1548822.1 hypothetical protein THOE12_10123 [Vibrio rotiferianus]
MDSTRVCERLKSQKVHGFAFVKGLRKKLLLKAKKFQKKCLTRL